MSTQAGLLWRAVGLCPVHICGPNLAGHVCEWGGAGPWACLFLRDPRLGTALPRVSAAPLHIGIVLVPLSLEGMSSLLKAEDSSKMALLGHLNPILRCPRGASRGCLPWADPGSFQKASA